MNNVGVFGKLNLRITDLHSGVTSDEDINNLITNYGLGRLFGPKELTEKIANRIYFGFRSEPANITDDIIPSDWKYIDIQTNTLNNPDDYSQRAANISVKNTLGAKGTIGNSSTTDIYRANHAYLAYVGSDNVAHALTSFRITKDDTPYEIKYASVEIEYDLVVSYPAMTTVDGVSNLKVTREYLGASIPLNHLYEPNAFRPSGVLSESSENFAIPLPGEWDDLSGTYIQKYKIIIKDTSSNSGQKYWFGPAMVSFQVTTAGEYELAMHVKRVDPDYNATAVSSLSKFDQYRLKVNAAPHQWLYVMTVGANPAVIDQAYIGIDGTAYLDNFSSLYNKGKTYTFWTTTANGTFAQVDLTTPDESADPLIAFYLVGKNTFRAIGNRGDKVEVMIVRPYTYSTVMESAGVTGTCTLESLDEPGYYYCDIEVPALQLSPEYCEDVRYTNTDLAGNVYTDNEYRKIQRLIYFPDMPYSWYSQLGGEVQTSTGQSEPMYPEASSGYVLEIMEFKGEII